MFKIEFDESYSQGPSLTYSIVAEYINDELKQQLANTQDKPISSMLFYKQRYTDGSYCDQVKRYRSTTLIYYCDQYGRSEDFTILDVSEPDWCDYQIRISTKYMCAKLKSLPRASQRALRNMNDRSAASEEKQKLSENAV